MNAGEPRRVPEKRCQPFLMIPLEPWNVERRVTSGLKVQRVGWNILSYVPLFAEWHRKLRRRATDIWNAVNRCTQKRPSWNDPWHLRRMWVPLVSAMTVSVLATRHIYVGGPPTVGTLVFLIIHVIKNGQSVCRVLIKVLLK